MKRCKGKNVLVADADEWKTFFTTQMVKVVGAEQDSCDEDDVETVDTLTGTAAETDVVENVDEEFDGLSSAVVESDGDDEKTEEIMVS